MVLILRNAHANKVKCLSPLPLFMGFVIGVISFYICLLLNYEDRNLYPVAIKQDHWPPTNLSPHRVDLTKSGINQSVSLLCVIFINDIDSLFMVNNVWSKKCQKNKIYVSKKKYKYTDHVVTVTYSSHPWKYYCQTLKYLHKKYISGTKKYDWIFLAKDNVWLIYENLVHLISLLNTNAHKHNYYAGQYVDGILSVDAGVLLSSTTLTSLVTLLNNMDACDDKVSNNGSYLLDNYLKRLNNVVPVSNEDSFGCTLFHSINLYDAFDTNSLRPEILKKCMSRSAITFQLQLSLGYYVLFYKYVLYRIRLVNEKDLTKGNSILPAPSPDDDNIWRVEAIYELNLDPNNMSQADFFYYWSKKRQIVL